MSNSFDVAQKEWSLPVVEISEEFEEWLRGKEIREHCYILNRLNGNEMHVRNICINRFIQIDTGTLCGEKEYTFLKQTMRKRTLSDAQIAWKVKVNQRIVDKTVVGNERPDVFALSAH